MKLVTGVDISTRAVRRSGRPGKPVKSSRRTAAAAANIVAFLLSIFIVTSDQENEVEPLVLQGFKSIVSELRGIEACLLHVRRDWLGAE